jgi:arylsulfatase A-like enzyme
VWALDERIACPLASSYDRAMSCRLISACCLIVLLHFACISNAQDQPADKPNIILIMTDDQGWGDVGYNGHPHLKTPSLDQMAKEGVKFTRFYSAAAMCSPTRASVYLGRNPYRTGVTFAMKGMLEPNELPITTVLKKQGYTTGHFGKWHLGTLSKKKGDQRRWGAFAKMPERYYCPPWERDVDVSFVTESKVPTWDPLKTPGKQDKPYRNDFFTGPGQVVTKNMEGDASRVVMDRAIPFIRDAVKADKPFFAVVWFHAPHSPVVGGPKYLEMYKDQPENTAHYYACLTAMDEQIGRLRAELKSLGVAGNTMITFCSDNGPARQGSKRHVGTAKHLKGYKLSIWEGGIRVPGLMVWPDKIKKPLTIDAPAYTGDYYATIFEVLDLDLPKDRAIDGISLLPFVRGQATQRTQPIGFLNKDGNQVVWMEQQYKLVQIKEKVMLFDIEADPSEQNDLAADKPAVVQRMKAAMDAWKAGVMADLAKVR